MAMSFSGGDEADKNHKDDAANAFGRKVGGDERFEEASELDLGDDDLRLPWLEGDDDDDLDSGRGNTAQLIALVLLGVVALGLIGGGIWWAQRSGPDETLVADGATIQAPATPYKTKPQNPGGDVVAGTGDTSFAVAEGQTRQVRIGNEAPAPAITPRPGPSASASATPSPASSSAASNDMSGVGVQVGAYSTRESADKGWTRLSQQYEALSGMRYRIVEGRADIGTVYRLQALPGDAAAANGLCTTLKGAGLSCQVKR